MVGGTTSVGQKHVWVYSIILMWIYVYSLGQPKNIIWTFPACITQANGDKCSTTQQVNNKGWMYVCLIFQFPKIWAIPAVEAENHCSGHRHWVLWVLWRMAALLYSYHWRRSSAFTEHFVFFFPQYKTVSDWTRWRGRVVTSQLPHHSIKERLVFIEERTKRSVNGGSAKQVMPCDYYAEGQWTQNTATISVVAVTATMICSLLRYEIYTYICKSFINVTIDTIHT